MPGATESGSPTIHDITELMGSYREAMRHLWNSLVPGTDLATFDSVDRFAKIDKLLFDGAVAPIIGETMGLGPGVQWHDRLRIVPSAKDGVPIRIENPRKDDRNHYWDHPTNRVRPDQGQLKFISYFDWWDLGMRDNQYYKVEILRFPEHPELEGRHALVEVGHAVVVVAADGS